ncbi:MAG TPA: cytochrome c [Steroidobacteraceae bacterium]|nr:cytochrome c [Steroidobacteraceae bacterium]
MTRRFSRALRWAVVLLVVVGAGSAYVAFGPDATDFARGRRVAPAAYRGHDPGGTPPQLDHATLVQRGEYLTRAADCVVCHTAKDGTPFIGGRAFVLPFGTLYSTNITPDLETGIGRYTDADFLSVLHRGIGRGGKRLYPAMPYPSYTLMSDADALAIKAYLFTLTPIHSPAPADTLAFPFNQRGLMSIWSALFNPDRRFEPNADRSDDWNRGAYLVEAMGHCGECHTPRNVFFGLNHRKKFQGAVQDGWRAFNITGDRDSGIGAWSDADIAHYLSHGRAAGHGAASGPMGEAVDESTSHLSSSDIQAMVTYLRTVPAIRSGDLAAARSTPASAQPDSLVAGAGGRGLEVYEGACAGCHGWTGVGSVIASANLTGTRAVNDPAGTNVVQMILQGSVLPSTEPTAAMPSFDGVFSHSDIAAVANYVTARFGLKGAELRASDVDKLRSEN